MKIKLLLQQSNILIYSVSYVPFGKRRNRVKGIGVFFCSQNKLYIQKFEYKEISSPFGDLTTKFFEVWK